MKPLPKPQPQPRTVTCATCQLFHRDTSGPSYNQDTHIYFMGTCTLGCDPDNTYNKKTNKAEIFADKPRLCPHHQPNHQPQQPLSAAQTKTINQFN